MSLILMDCCDPVALAGRSLVLHGCLDPVALAVRSFGEDCGIVWSAPGSVPGPCCP